MLQRKKILGIVSGKCGLLHLRVGILDDRHGIRPESFHQKHLIHALYQDQFRIQEMGVTCMEMGRGTTKCMDNVFTLNGDITAWNIFCTCCKCQALTGNSAIALLIEKKYMLNRYGDSKKIRVK